MTDYPALEPAVAARIRRGMVIPAHPLALTADRRFDERRQRALTRYYHAAGAGGLAVGVHTTQFEIRRSEYGLFGPVLELAAETVRALDAATGRNTTIIAGICGANDQAVDEATRARSFGYHAGLLSLAGLGDAAETELLRHAGRVAEVLPLVGFYLQPAVGGRHLSSEFWRAFASIPNVVAIKIAPFDRYRTLDVVRGVAESGRAGEVALYTGNDDNIVADLVTEFVHVVDGAEIRQWIVGGLLGQWAVGTRAAVALLERCRAAREAGVIDAGLLTLGAQLTELNAAAFDAGHRFAGCIAGIHEVLRLEGLMENIACLDPAERLSPGQGAAIARAVAAYGHLLDREFIGEHVDAWMRS